MLSFGQEGLGFIAWERATGVEEDTCSESGLNSAEVGLAKIEGETWHCGWVGPAGMGGWALRGNQSGLE